MGQRGFCGLIHHELDREVEGSNLAAAELQKNLQIRWCFFPQDFRCSCLQLLQIFSLRIKVVQGLSKSNQKVKFLPSYFLLPGGLLKSEIIYHSY